MSEIDRLQADNAKLRSDLAANTEWWRTCKSCGAPLFDGDDYFFDADGAAGCWHAVTIGPTRRCPCYAYRVGKPGFTDRVTP